ncbi:hypothetical protein [Clostridium polynesiense]|uniref:hypothetical protein n=1 Tax=Clostridium polynesiense TaxID=1325933 RepID=UPI00059169ED|nr:hypothetical protein [Clostridium polynesiense]
MRLWGKIIKNNKIIKNDTVPLEVKDNYQAGLKAAIAELCHRFDIEKPYWLNKNLNEYNRISKTAFNENNFIEDIDFDKFIIEELEDKNINKR